MKDSQTDEENSFFLQRSKQMYLLEGRIISFLSKETNEEMEIKDIYIQGGFFNWSALKMTKCQTLRKF